MSFARTGSQAGSVGTALAVGRLVISRVIPGSLHRPLSHSAFVEVTLMPLRLRESNFAAWDRERPPPAAVSVTHHTSLITVLLITPRSSLHYSSHLNHHSTTHHTSLIIPLVNHTMLSCGRRSTQSLLAKLLRAWAPLGRGWLSCDRRSTRRRLEELLRAWSLAGPRGPRLAFVWQAYYAEPSGGVAACVIGGWPAWSATGFRAAGGLHRVWRSCCARVRRLARGWRSYGSRSTQGLLEELLRTWSPPGPRLTFVWHAQYTEPSGGAVARAVASWSVGYVNVPLGSRDKRRCENWCFASS